MIWLLCGYIWLYIYRPFEIWPELGALRVERVYMIFVMTMWLVSSSHKFVRNPLNTAFSILFMVVVVAWLFSPYRELGFKSVEEFAKIGVFYILVMTTVKDEKGLRTIILAFLASMGLYMSHSLWEYGCGRHQWSGMGLRRMIGIDNTNSHPNNFAACILYALPMLLPCWTTDARRITRPIVVGYLLLAIICIALTGSRTSFVGLVFLAVITAVVFSRRRIRAMALVAVLAVVAWSCLPQDKQDRFMTIIDPSRGSANAQASAVSRKDFFVIGVQLWRDNPILGLGPASFPVASGTGMSPHGLYTQVLSELGTVGSLALILVLAGFFRNARQMKRLTHDCPQLSDSYPYRVSRAVSIAVLVLLLVGLAGHNLFRYTWMWFGAFQAIALHIATRYADESNPYQYGYIDWIQPTPADLPGQLNDSVTI